MLNAVFTAKKVFGERQIVPRVGEHGLEQRPEWIIKDRGYGDGLMGLNYTFSFPEDNMPEAFVCNNDVRVLNAVFTAKKVFGERQIVPRVGFS